MATKIVTKNSSTAGSAPSASDLVQGELAVNVVDKRLYTEDNAGNIVELGTNPLGEITANGGIALGDNDKATFGAGDDLQIYHDGTDSFVADTGTGDLYLQGSSNIFFRKGNGNEVFAHFADDGACKLRFDNSTKIATTSTGIDVTGNMIADGVGIGTSSPSSVLHASGEGATFTLQDTRGTGNTHTLRSSGTNGGSLQLDSAQDLYLNADTHIFRSASEVERMRINSSGRVGIGTDSPSSKLHLSGDGDSASKLTVQRTGATIGTAVLGYNYLGSFSNNDFKLFTNSTERMRIDSTGRVGIGTDSPDESLEVNGDAKISGADSGNAGVLHFGGVSDDVKIAGFDRNSGTANSMLFYTNSAERMRIDSSGNLLVGKSATTFSATGIENRADGRITSTRSGNTNLLLNRLSSDGSLIDFYKNGTTVGSIGTVASRLFIGNDDVYLTFQGASDRIYPASSSGGGRDNAIDLGDAGARFDDIYATNGTIQTSDRNEKQDIAELSDAETAVAVACKGLLRKFRWKDSVAEKGDDARTHFGIIAQDLQAAFAAEGLDAGDYAMFISTTWTDEETNEEKTRMGVRYSELLAFIIAAI